MLGLAELTVGLRDLHDAAKRSDNKTAAEMPFKNRQEALRVAQLNADIYYENYRYTVLPSTLLDVADNSMEYYSKQLGVDVDDFDESVREIVTRQFTDKYYGKTLDERLDANAKRLARNIIRTAAVGQGFEHLAGILTDRIPFGAQFDLDKRMMLATAVKVEQDVARYMAEKVGAQLVKWNVSPYHKVTDICDDYATYSDKAVVRYIEDNNLDISPKGVYFINQLPHPPHPNCMCEYGIITGRSEPARGIVRRSKDKLAAIINRLRRK